MQPVHKQVFLGGACGRTTWRREIAIPALQAAGVTYYDPQLGVGEWSPACEAIEMRAKQDADVLLFVINHETRGVASIGEVAYSLGCGRKLALVVSDVCGYPPEETDDLNRGRIFLRTMARHHRVPVFSDILSAVRHAIHLVRAGQAPLDAARLRAILSAVRFKDAEYLLEEIEAGFLLQIRCREPDARTGECREFHGRKWHIANTATESDVVRTAFKAAITWQEHEGREAFTYCGIPLFGPHQDVQS